MDRVKAILEDPFYMDCLGKNGEREKNRRYCKHDLQHMALVSQVSYKILLESGNLENLIVPMPLPGPDTAREIVYAAGLLHDIARWVQYDTGEDHAQAGARLARPVLEQAGFNRVEIEIILRAIREHRKSGPGQSLLGKVLCLADDLSRPCSTCGARLDCYKYEQMERIKERGHASSFGD